jgi:hypothetical protein
MYKPHRKLLAKTTLILALCMFAAYAAYVNASPDQANQKSFVLLEHIGYLGAPDFSQYGFEKSYIVYEQFLYDQNEDRKQAIKQSRIQRVAHRIRRTLSPGSFVQLDIEGWHESDPRQQGWVRQQYLTTIQRFKTELPEYQLGYYRIVPVWAHWDMHKNPRLKEQWHKENSHRVPIAEQADVLYPALYTYHKDPEKWTWTAKQVMQKAREMANGKPVIPFIWPMFHPSSDVGGGGDTPLSEAYFAKQLELVYQYADGVIIWNDGTRALWSDDLPWWRATERFIRQNLPEKLRFTKSVTANEVAS